MSQYSQRKCDITIEGNIIRKPCTRCSMESLALSGNLDILFDLSGDLDPVSKYMLLTA